MTTEQFYNDFLDKLKLIYDAREADNIADWVFEKVTGNKKMDRRISKSEEITSGYALQLDKHLEELLQHKPVQYVLNEAWFYKMKFFVDQHALIPRPETEELVSWVITDVRTDKRNQHVKILDIGTGSGCIAISLKKNLENIEAFAIDVSKETLAIADRNALSLNAEICFSQVDFLNKKFSDSLGRYDVVVSNPPYIPQFEKERLSKNVTLFEPSIALFVQNNDPFIFYERIAEFSQSHLNAEGKVYVEIHENYSKEVEQVFLRYGFDVESKRDIYGKDRMIKAVKQ